MSFRLPNLDYYTMLSGIGESLANAYDKYQAPKLLAEAMQGVRAPDASSSAQKDAIRARIKSFGIDPARLGD